MERAQLWLALGNSLRADLANSEALGAYAKALDAATRSNITSLVGAVKVGLAQSYMTVDPGKARALMDEVLALPADPQDEKLIRAQLLDLRGRASLNLGQASDAMPFFTEAIKLSGGLGGSRVNLLQIPIRGDAALGALQTNHPDRAREYLSESGAGHLPSDEWTNGMGDPPVCGDATGIHAEDSAVVEFSIGADGRVIGTAPIYASRPGGLGLAFAQAVRQWFWNPERIATIPAFWRNLVRIEMRCREGQSPRQLSAPFYEQTRAWLAGSSLAAADLEPLKKRYVPGDDPRLEREDLAAVPALMTRLPLETNPKRVETIAHHLDAALAQSGAPAAARALAMHLKPEQHETSVWSFEHVQSSARQLAVLEKLDPQSSATAWLTLEYAIALEANGQFKQARPVLERVLAFAPEVLDAHDPLRDVATLHLAALARRSGDTAGAEARVAAAGITREQCMLFDVRPVPTKLMDFSAGARRESDHWGIDGYLRVAFDIDAAGHPENVRTVIAYPPFVFQKATERSLGGSRYLAPVVDGVAAGCTGHLIGVIYRNGR